MWVFNERHDFGVETDPTQSEFFVNNEIDRNSSLIRETIQNSLDARRDDSPCVEVRFTFHEGALFLDASALHRYVDGLVPHLAACGVDVEAVGLDHPRFLLVEDFGTHGLRGDPGSKSPSDFYFFWHVVGRSGKGDTKAGRWGLGKTVFPNSSQVSAFFGYTIRSDDRRRLFLGQTCLRTHEADGVTYLPYAFYQRSGPRQFELPFEAPDALNRFRDEFRLARREEAGLSVAIPYPYPELTETALVEAAIEHYFFAILAGRLVVRVNDQVVNAQTILGIAERLQSRRLKDIEKALNFASEIQRLPADAIVSVDEPDRLNSEVGRIPPDAFDPEHLRLLRDAFRDQRIVALRLPVTIEPRGAPPQASFVTIYLRRDPMLLRGHDYYLRSGITLTGQSVFSGRPALGILLADDTPVCRFLGDAENPAHTLWNPRSPRLAAKYHRARDTVMFLREAMAGLLDTLTQTDAEEDRHALSQIFFTPRKQEREEKQRQTQPATAPDIASGGQQATLLIAPIQGGFRLKAGPGLSAARLPLKILAQVSYEIRRGNGFKKYSPQDFRLDHDPIAIVSQGVSGLRSVANKLEFTVVATTFEVEVRGFDVHRDVAVRVVERDDTAS